MEELEHLSETNSTVTIFAPDDQAFEGFDEDSECWTPEELEHVRIFHADNHKSFTSNRLE